MSSTKGEEKKKDTLGDRFYSLREKSGLSMDKFGGTIGVSGGYINDIEKDVKTNVSDTVILLTSHIYLVNAEWLLTGNGEKLYPSDFQTTNGDNAKKTPSGEDIRMTETQMIAIVEELTRLKIRIEQLESQCPGYQKKNQQR